jgi:hypothetical protein
VAGALAAIVSLLLLGVVGASVNIPGQWSSVIAFLCLVGFGFVLPQLYLIRTDPTTSQTARLGVITFITLILGGSFAGDVSGVEAKAIGAIVVLSILAPVVHQFWVGYRQPVQTDIR